MSKPSDSFIPIWMVLSVLAGLIGSAYTYLSLTKHNPNAAAAIGIKCFMLMYIVGWVIFRISRFVERTSSDSENKDENSEK
ncbi:MAG: hypothetical protein NT018_11690 [Armatimonadetes bacterium]|nr:hypothetical protein [Armatimonadota bacterium]